MSALRPHSLPIREFLSFVYCNEKLLLRAFFIPFVLAVLLSFIPTPHYPATGVLVVRLGSEYVYQPETGMNPTSPQAMVRYDRDQIFKAEVAILGSDDLHQQVIEKMGVENLYPSLFKINVLKVIFAVIYYPLQWLGVIDNPTPEERAQRRLAEAVELFDKRLEINLERESAVITVSYEHKNAELAVKTLTTLFDLYLQKRKDLYLEPRVKLAQVQMDQAQQNAAVAAQAVEHFKRENNVHSLSDERAALLRQRADVEHAKASVESSALDGRATFYNQQLDRLDQLESQLGQLEHDVKVTNEEVTVYAHQLGEAKAFENLARERVGSVRIIQEPTVPTKPRDMQMLIVFIGFVFSLISMFIVAAVKEFMTSSYLTPEKLERDLGLPVLAVVPFQD